MPARTVPPKQFDVPDVGSVIANAVPDPFDARDLPYLPRLQPLPAVLDQRDLPGRYVLKQEGQSCTGHALATVINTVLAPRDRPGATAKGAVRKKTVDARGNGNGRKTAKRVRVSPYMLYHLARRYDEFAGEEDVGSSLRGALKGWFHHGVVPEHMWPTIDDERDLEDPDFAAECRKCPLGAFYRVNAFRLDDMQSAINELHAIAVSAAIHDGWLKPRVYTHGRRAMRVIEREKNPQALGGHAFALVGYNDVGFLVQNSWGTDWGKGGFVTLPYEDWLECAYDAWVVRPGVPQTPFTEGRVRDLRGTGGQMAIRPGPDLQRLDAHVVNLGNQGRLSTLGTFVSTPAQIHRIFGAMDSQHAKWLAAEPGRPRHIVLYAHGGLVSETAGLETAEKHLNWWLNNRVYPIYFAWQSGPAETLVNRLVDLLKGRLPFGGLGFDLVEQFDRLVEKFARANVRWMWDEMKQNAEAASDPLSDEDRGTIQWPPPQSAKERKAMAQLPGASLTVTRLARYIDQVGRKNVRVHLVGHSAGSIFLAPLLDRLRDENIDVDSLTLLAPAIRVDDFAQKVLPHIGNGKTVRRFATFALTDKRELDDTVGVGNVRIYQKSLLYLVSRALEQPAAKSRGAKGPAAKGDDDDKYGEVRLLGMAKFFDRPVGNGIPGELGDVIEAVGGVSIFSRSAAPADSRTDSLTHGGFDDDGPTMTSVVMRVLGVADPKAVDDYVSKAALKEDGAPAAGRTVMVSPPDTERGTKAGRPKAPAEPLQVVQTVHEPGTAPVTEVSEAPGDERLVFSSAAFGSGTPTAPEPPIAKVLKDRGWKRLADQAPVRER